MFERFAKASSAPKDGASVEAFMEVFRNDGHKAKPAKDGWAPLPGSGKGAVYELTSGQIWWPSKSGAAADAKLFKGYAGKAEAERREAIQKGDTATANGLAQKIGWFKHVGTSGFSFAGPEYFLMPEREGQMASGETGWSFPGGGK